ncbi:MAG: TRAP transporter substrate-binding protein [Desulfobacterales bacterium]|nr:TRAP transporter substrate-binding protein [Desulfobacterales bacterium]
MRLVVLIIVTCVHTLSCFAEPIYWDMHLNYSQDNFHSEGAKRFADKVKLATQGQLIIRLHPSGGLGLKGAELLRAVAEGRLAISEIPTGMVEHDAPVLSLTAQPFVSSNSFEQRLLYQLAKRTYQKVLFKFNQFTLYTSIWPLSGIYTQRPVRQLGDLKGLKIRVFDGTGIRFGELVGMSTRKLEFSEVYPALKAGLLDAMMTSSVSGVDAKAWEVFDYFTPVNILGPVNMINVNFDAWKRLSKSTQNAVLDIADQMENEMWNLADDMDRSSLRKLKVKGIKVLKVDRRFRVDLESIGEKMRVNWLNRAGPDARDIMSRYRVITHRD